MDPMANRKKSPPPEKLYKTANIGGTGGAGIMPGTPEDRDTRPRGRTPPKPAMQQTAAIRSGLRKGR
ncbi:MAG: hypothetical protein NW223_23625 [Hyphomicrobiaceae bacterium]|nr:hypothetical protein [Hyphomicrobiaceae bacterium]